MKVVFWSFHVGAVVMAAVALCLFCGTFTHGEVALEPCVISKNVACSIARYECKRRSAVYDNSSMQQKESGADYRFMASVNGQPCGLVISKSGGSVRWEW